MGSISEGHTFYVAKTGQQLWILSVKVTQLTMRKRDHLLMGSVSEG
jgi:hypothetical protein